jgi:hypothetical protein
MNSPSPRFFLQRRDGAERPPSWRGRRYWIVARSLCAFRVFRLPDPERGNLKDFAALKVREWAPYEEFGFQLDLSREAARVWVWDAARVRGAMLALGVKPGRVAVLPETALQERPGDGLRLLACLEGFEGQYWRGGELKASRWWAATPSPVQWLDFQRAAGVAAPSHGDPPAPEQPAWRSRPWVNSGGNWRHGVEHRSPEVVLATAALLLAGHAYLGGSIARDAWTLSDLDGRMRSAERRSAPAISERERALTNVKFLGDFATLDPYPSQLELFARIAEKLPANGARIIAWSYQSGDLQFTIFSPNSPPDILFYVKTYSAVERLTDVTADRAEGNRSIRIKAHVTKS